MSGADLGGRAGSPPSQSGIDEVCELLTLTGRAVATMMGAAPAGEAMICASGALGFCGEAAADLNMIVVQAAPDPAGLLSRALSRAEQLQLPCIAFVDPRAVEAIAPLAQAAGLEFAGTIPLMVFDAATPVSASRVCDIREATSPADASAACDLAARAFSIDRGIVARAWEPTLTPDGPARTFIAWDADAPRSAVTVARSGSTAGIFTMATDPAQHGRGWGRALLSTIMEQQRRAGVQRFYLQATTAGLPLYGSLGYRTLVELPVYVLGAATQAP
ncbi:MAG TPA: GNAT family N-acetyltransferase [Caulobacteraceae bacterium]|jgi:GNAT superfamily N-acetyltransferase|nr:GNAT family N-acetyltransferase [Caulobacteraceae bacterium]